MEFPAYVARRMLDEVCDIPTRTNSYYEPGFTELFDWMELYTNQFGARILYQLPNCKATRHELLDDIVELFAGILSRVNDVHDMTTLHSLFTISFYMMVIYKDHPIMCGYISHYFEVISFRFRSWNSLPHGR